MRLIAAIFILISFSACKTNKLQPKIATDKKDPRVKTLVGAWYSVKDPFADRPSKYTKTVGDTCVVWTIKKNGSIIIENQFSHTTSKSEWILRNNKFYIKLNLEKEIYAIYVINIVSESELQVKFLGYKNVYMPFLCDYESMEYPLNDNVFEYPTNDRARFGVTKDDLTNYINKTIKLPENIKERTQCSVLIKTNCNGEVVEAKLIGGTFFTKKTEFEESIVQVIEKMPKWSPATKRDLAKIETINSGSRFLFTYKDGKIIVMEG